MALIAGAGNPTGGSSPSGTGTSINYLRFENKTIAYAYSGAIAVTGSDQVVIDHTTGNETVEGKVIAQYMHASASNDDVLMKFELNGQHIGGSVVATDYGASNVLGPENWIPIVIPPFSRFKITFTMLSGGGDIDLGINITGEVYA